MSNELLSQIASDLEAIKKLMVFELMNKGHSQAKIATALGTSQASISRMFPKVRGEKTGGSSGG